MWTSLETQIVGFLVQTKGFKHTFSWIEVHIINVCIFLRTGSHTKYVILINFENIIIVIIIFSSPEQKAHKVRLTR